MVDRGHRTLKGRGDIGQVFCGRRIVRREFSFLQLHSFFEPGATIAAHGDGDCRQLQVCFSNGDGLADRASRQPAKAVQQVYGSCRHSSAHTHHDGKLQRLRMNAAVQIGS
jgi:hypothetical protein